MVTCGLGHCEGKPVRAVSLNQNEDCVKRVRFARRLGALQYGRFVCREKRNRFDFSVVTIDCDLCGEALVVAVDG